MTTHKSMPDNNINLMCLITERKAMVDIERPWICLKIISPIRMTYIPFPKLNSANKLPADNMVWQWQIKQAQRLYNFLIFLSHFPFEYGFLLFLHFSFWLCLTGYTVFKTRLVWFCKHGMGEVVLETYCWILKLFTSPFFRQTVRSKC